MIGNFLEPNRVDWMYRFNTGENRVYDLTVLDKDDKWLIIRMNDVDETATNDILITAIDDNTKYLEVDDHLKQVDIYKLAVVEYRDVYAKLMNVVLE